MEDNIIQIRTLYCPLVNKEKVSEILTEGTYITHQRNFFENGSFMDVFAIEITGEQYVELGGEFLSEEN